MLPGLLCSYLISNAYAQNALLTYNPMVLRIAFASFLAYVLGQLLDIAVFQRLRAQSKWWVAPSVSNVFGNLFDTYCFFFVAFYHSTNGFLSIHWVEIATVDLVFKLLISMVSFLPLYGFILKLLLQNRPMKASVASN
ncbi:membrane protein [Legionella jamestowniensis]|uniref:Queuosine precursor transporter n=2 Tax=Legionella jamestowniensis TaxID=455 RepID=A0A0W0UIR5_9GAMM|nr:membrane protein [Legionella jamestowniensis]